LHVASSARGVEAAQWGECSAPLREVIVDGALR
jgi:hypothetical protein